MELVARMRTRSATGSEDTHDNQMRALGLDKDRIQSKAKHIGLQVRAMQATRRELNRLQRKILELKPQTKGDLDARRVLLMQKAQDMDLIKGMAGAEKGLLTDLRLQSSNLDKIEVSAEELQNRNMAKKFGLHIADVEKLSQTFKKIDTNKSGTLERDEFDWVYRDITGLGPDVEIPRKRIDELLDMVDQDRSGTVDFEEYLMVCVQLGIV